MPELPEVETVVRGLERQLPGRVVKTVAQTHLKLRVPLPDLQVLVGATVLAVRRRAKFVLVDFSNKQTLLIHLGMSGRIVFTPPHTPPAKHDHVRLTFTKGDELRFNDPRRFGLMDICPTGAENKTPHLKTMGPEPFHPTFNSKYLHTKIKSKKTAIKPTIMESKLVVGVGNIYASEALFRAGINPTRAANKLSLAQCEKLVTCIQQTLQDAIQAGGTSLRDYVQTDGTLGYFQHQFNVYNREGQPCRVCGTPIKRIVQAARSTYFCPTCQK